MIAIIAGGRDLHLGLADFLWLDGIRQTHRIHKVLEGGQTGADRWGRRWASSRGIPVETYRAKWSIHGRAAGPIRNGEMANAADMVILFKGGKGTESMRKEAQKRGLLIIER